MYQNRIEKYVSPPQPSEEGSENPLLQKVQPAIQKVGHVVARTIRKQPVASVAIGLAIGVALGCYIKRT